MSIVSVAFPVGNQFIITYTNGSGFYALNAIPNLFLSKLDWKESSN
jgi:hypothetical protein